ncbi:MAG TPA: ABC transporter ATP-binding protein, partial [Steroidobacteraceae bacterium]|nr:ABC transporter ATP-binding protein [Steroidobacteraceae bacterium]
MTALTSPTSSALAARTADSSAHPAAIVARADAPALRVATLRKHYGSLSALDGVSFRVGRGEIVGLLGPNGAGKTTTINVILGLLEPTSGRVEIDGIDIAHHRARALERTNFAAVYASLPGNLTVSQNLRFFGLLYDVRGLPRRIEELLGEFDLVHLR